MDKILLPGATVGVLGSGQLGRMFAIAARRMGYRVHTLSPDTDTPTGQIADREVTASYDDLDAIKYFARSVSVLPTRSKGRTCSEHVTRSHSRPRPRLRVRPARRAHRRP